MTDMKIVDGDMVLTADGDMALVPSGIEARRQDLEMAFQTWLTETPYDTEEGVAYLQVFFRKETTDDTRIALLTNRALSRPGILSCALTFVKDNATGVFTVSGTAQSIDGPFDFSVALSPTP